MIEMYPQLSQYPPKAAALGMARYPPQSWTLDVGGYLLLLADRSSA